MNKLQILLGTLVLLNVSCDSEKVNEEETNNDSQAGVEQTEKESQEVKFPEKIELKEIAQNPEGIEYYKSDKTFFLSSLNAGPIIKVHLDGSFSAFTSGDPYPISTAGLQIDQENNRLIAACFNGLELMDEDPNTKGVSNVRFYNLETGELEQEVNLSGLIPDASAYMANDIAVDNDGNTYITDWYAGVVYKVNGAGNSSVFWKNNTGLMSGANGIDFHPEGYLIVSLVSVNEQGLYANYGLVKIPIDAPESAKLITSADSGFTGFDGMNILKNGHIVGVTNNGNSPGGNTLLELSSSDNWTTFNVVDSKSISPSTTIATVEGSVYVINQDFMDNEKTSWIIEKIDL